MTERELHNEILKIAYDAEKRGHNVVTSNNLMTLLPQADEKSLRRCVTYLRNKGYLDKVLLTKDDFSFSGLSSEGLMYVEDKLLAPFDNYTHDIIDDDIEEKSTPTYYKSIQIRETYKEGDVEGCFNVDSLAKCFLEHIDDICSGDLNNVPMIGVFAPWGRGKTYFFNKVRNLINKRDSRESGLKYDVIDFNVWKYPDTPALWAYLFEVIYKSRNWYTKSLYFLRRNFWLILMFILIVSSVVIYIHFLVSAPVPFVKWIYSIITILFAIFLLIDKHLESASALINKYFHRPNFSNEMGVRTEISNELKSLVRFCVKDNRSRILLYVDDIDRCLPESMLETLEAFRTFLEEDDIKGKLVVVCSADMSILHKTLLRRYKQSYPDSSEDDLRKMCINQIDKIFISSITLQTLSFNDYFEYLEKLSGDTFDVESTRSNLLKSYLGSSYVENKVETNIDNFTKEYLLWVIRTVLNEDHDNITPRQLKHVYYRSLLAMNILASEDKHISTDVIRSIVRLSCGDKLSSLQTCISSDCDVVNMVIPFERS